MRDNAMRRNGACARFARTITLSIMTIALATGMAQPALAEEAAGGGTPLS